MSEVLEPESCERCERSPWHLATSEISETSTRRDKMACASASIFLYTKSATICACMVGSKACIFGHVRKHHCEKLSANLAAFRSGTIKLSRVFQSLESSFPHKEDLVCKPSRIGGGASKVFPTCHPSISTFPGAALWGGPLPGPKSLPNQQFLIGTLYLKNRQVLSEFVDGCWLFHSYSQTSSTEFHPRAPKGHEFHLKDKNLISYDFMAFCGSRSGIVRGTLARPKIIAKSTIFSRNFIQKKWQVLFEFVDGWWWVFMCIAKPQALNFILEHLRAMNFIWRTRIWFHMIYMISWHSVAPGAALWGEPLPGPKSLPNQQFLVGTLYKKNGKYFLNLLMADDGFSCV